MIIYVIKILFKYKKYHIKLFKKNLRINKIKIYQKIIIKNQI